MVDRIHIGGSGARRNEGKRRAQEKGEGSCGVSEAASGCKCRDAVAGVTG
jgi:hypothetical protein